MAIKKTTPLAILQKDPTSFLLHAEPKVGKTYLAGTFPGTCFVSCPSDEALTLAALPGAASREIYQVETWEDFCKACLGLAEKPRTPEFQTLCIDTWTFAYNLAVEHVLSLQRDKTLVSQDTWTQTNRRVLSLLDNVKRANYNTGKNFIALCHSRSVNVGDDRNPDYHTRVDLGDSLRGKFLGRFSSIFYLRMIGADKRELLMKRTPKIDVGSRYKFDKNLLNPDAETILTMIQEYKLKVETANG
jgi:hypothetical protein